MGEYDTMQVCRNGHKITGRYHDLPEQRQEYCEQCGAETITECEACGTEIQGYYKVEGVASADRSDRPDFCHSCGEAHPWNKQE